MAPTLAFLFVCLVYLLLPSNHFNTDALHYNLTALIAVEDPPSLLRDEATPVHLLWHLVATGLLALCRPSNPEHSLYILRLWNIALALLSIFLFMRLVRRYADEWTTVWATLTLAFSNACLRHFLSLEVYSLNNVVVTLTLLVVFRTTRASDGAATPGSPVAPFWLGLLTALAIGAHLTNALLIIPSLFLICFSGARRPLRQAGVYLLTIAALSVLAVAGIALASERSFLEGLQYALNYSNDASLFMSSDPLAGLSRAIGSLQEAILPRYGALLLLPAAGLALLAVRRRDLLKKDPWAGFLAVYLLVGVVFVTRWDPENIEHKITLIPPALLLAARIHSLAGAHLQSATRAAAAITGTFVVGSGLIYSVLPYTRLEDYEPYRLSAQIHDATANEKVVLISESDQANTIALASMTFFHQQVVLVEPADPRLADTVRGYESRGFHVLRDLPGKAGAPGGI